MSIKKYKLTAEGLTLDRKNGLLLDAIEDREKCPQAFLFSADEIKLIYKAREALMEVSDKFRDIPEENYTPELQSQMLDAYANAFKRKRIALTKLRKYSERMKTALYWSASIYAVNLGGKWGLKPYEIYLITTSTPEEFPEQIINPQTHPAFYSASNKAEQANALGIPELYLFVSKTELSIFNALKIVVEQLTTTSTQEPEAEEPAEVKQLMTIVNSPEMNAYINIGANARREPKKSKRLDERGRQLTIYEFLSTGATAQFEYNPLAGQGLISAGDPNTDKLLLQAQSEVIKTGQKEITIPISEFMNFRGLKDKKTACEKARAACDTLMCCTVKIDASTPNASIYDTFHYVQRCRVISNKGRAGNVINIIFSDAVYNHLITMSAQGRQLEQIDLNIMRIPDNEGTAYNIARKFNSHLRINAEKPTARRLSVKTLLNHCSRLPLYPEQPEQFGTGNYIRKPFEAQTRIIQPFCNSLKFLVEFGILSEFKFVHEGGRSLTAAERKRLESDYNLFTSLFVEVKFNIEHDYAHLIEEKNKQIEKAKKTKSRKKSKDKN